MLLGKLEADLGNVDEAAALLEDAATILRESGSLVRGARLVRAEAALLAARGDVRGAVAHLDADIAELREHGMTWQRALEELDAVRLLAGIDHAAAASRVEALIAEAERLEMRGITARVRGALRVPAQR